MKNLRLRSSQRVALLVAVAAFLNPRSTSGAQVAKDGDTGKLFTGKTIPHLRIEIPSEGMEILRHYQFDINDLMERSNVLATVREGQTVYTNVAVHLKGHLGSFQPL